MIAAKLSLAIAVVVDCVCVSGSLCECAGELSVYELLLLPLAGSARMLYTDNDGNSSLLTPSPALPTISAKSGLGLSETIPDPRLMGLRFSPQVVMARESYNHRDGVVYARRLKGRIQAGENIN